MEITVQAVVATIRGWVDENFPPAVGLLVIAILNFGYYAWTRPAPGSPPVVPYWLPWIGSAVSLGQDPDSFFRVASKKLGPIFCVQAAGRSVTYVTSPTLIAAIYRDSKTFEFQSIRQKISTEVFSIPTKVVKSTDVTETYYPAHHRVLAPKNIGSILERYAKYTHEQLSEKISALDGTSVPLVELIILPAYIAAANAFFGKAFPAEETYAEFERFNSAFHILVAGLPQFVTAGPRKAWDVVVDSLETYIGVIRKTGEFPELVDVTLSVGDHAGWGDRVHASLFGGDLWAMESNAIWAAYWFLVLLLQHPSDLRRITSEIDAARTKWSSSHSDTPLSASNFHQFITDSADQFPLLTSGIQETLRLRTSSFSIRRVTRPTEFGGYTFNVGDELVCNTRIIHMDEEIHDRPYEFILDRYVDSQKKYVKSGNPVPNHSLPFGGGVSMCEGRHFAQAEIKTFAIILLSCATIGVGQKYESWPTPAMDRIGVGIISPKGDVNVIVRKRGI